MRLYIGGRSQGKTECCLSEQTGAYVLLDGALVAAGVPGAEEKHKDSHLILNSLHEWVRGCVKEKIDPIECMRKFLAMHPDADIICDEVGNGVVPIDPFEREWREAVGRTLIFLAKEAESVTRVICGLPQKIK